MNSFGYGGSNVHVILDEAKTELPLSAMSFKSSYMQEDDDLFADDPVENPHLLVFSANDVDSLKRYCQSLSIHLLNPRVRISLPDLAHTLSERRSRHFHRAYLITRTPHFDPHNLVFGKLHPNRPRVGFVFTGQGAQWPQMGQSIVDAFQSARELLQHLDRVLQSLPNPPSWTLSGRNLHVEGKLSYSAITD